MAIRNGDNATGKENKWPRGETKVLKTKSLEPTPPIDMFISKYKKVISIFAKEQHMDNLIIVCT